MPHRESGRLAQRIERLTGKSYALARNVPEAHFEVKVLS